MNRIIDLFQICSLSVFLLLFIGRTMQLRSRGIRVITLISGKPWPEALLEALFLIAFPLWIADIMLHAWLPASWAVDPVVFKLGWLGLAGAPLQVIAIGLFAWSLASFGSSWRVGVDRASPDKLVTSGVFSWSRNPIFLSMDLFLIGSVLLTGRLGPMLFALAALAGFHRQILAEERFLESHYGATYREYYARVRRYLGRREVASCC